MSTSRDSLRFVKGSGCYSYVGRVGGPQPISVGFGCEYVSMLSSNSLVARFVIFAQKYINFYILKFQFGIVAHEIGHALGFFHEQARSDRDDYLSINLANISPARIGNFDKRNADEIITYDIPYEYGRQSIVKSVSLFRRHY